MRLLTERLELRPPEERDLDALISFFRDPRQAGPELGPQPKEDDALARAAFTLAESDALWAEHGYGPFVIGHREAVIGLCGLRPTPDGARPSDIDVRDPAPPLLFYGVARPFQRFGIAKEAASACLTVGFEHLGFARIDACAHEDNAASIHLLHRLGFEDIGFRRLFKAHLLGFKALAPAQAGEASAA